MTRPSPHARGPRSSGNVRRAVVVAAVLGGTALACQLVAGIERVDKVDPVGDVADAAPAPDTSAPKDPCNHVLPPAKPLVDDAPNDKVPDFYLALRRLELVPQSGAPEVGFDLDGVCTCTTSPDTAFEGGASCVSSRPPACDADGGIDNAGGKSLRDFSSFVDIDEAVRVNKRIDEGSRNTILIISSYNGRANDKEIGVGIFTSEGIRTPSPCPGSVPSGNGLFTPGWCGEDVWTATSTTVNSTPDGKFVPKAIGNGYVSNYEFVVRLGGFAQIPFGGYRLSVGSSVTTGRLVPLDAAGNPIDTTSPPDPASIKRWRVAGAVLAGRIPASDLVAAFATTNVPGADAGGGKPPALCTSTTIFPLIKTNICDSIDINNSDQLDFEKDVVCDSVSVAVAMTADQAKVSGVVPPEDPTVNDCYPTADGGGPINGPPGVTYRCP